MSTSGGTPGPSAANSGVAVTGASSQETAAFLYAYNGGGSWRPVFTATATGDGDAPSDWLAVASGAMTSGSALDRLRTPKVFTPLNAVAVGSEATIWTPTSGKKFRLMGIVIASGTVGGGILLKDNTAGTTIAIVPTATVAVAVAMSLGNGILSAAANNVLTATGIATETITGTVFGTEE